ncbi:MAG: FAD:protein FMN transferase [Candidatus Hydrogenedentota bacterium]
MSPPAPRLFVGILTLVIGMTGIPPRIGLLSAAEYDNGGACYKNSEEQLEDESEMYDVVPNEYELRPVELTHRAMAAEFRIVAFPRSPEEPPQSIVPIVYQAFDAIDRVEELISTWRPESQASYVNKTAAEQPVAVSREFFDLVAKAKSYWERTDGAFDLTIGPLMEVWGRYEDQPAVPSEDELTEIVNEIGMDKVILDEHNTTIAFETDTVRLDFGGIGKGYALDEAAKVLKEYGVDHALLDGGTSSFLAMGAPPGLDAWRISIRHPNRPDDSIDTVELRDESLGASGIFRSLMRAGDEEVSDIVDPRTGQPAQEVVTVSVVGSTATESEMLATAFVVMGPEGIRAYCDANPEVRAIVLANPEDGAMAPEWVNFADKED